MDAGSEGKGVFRSEDGFWALFNRRGRAHRACTWRKGRVSTSGVVGGDPPCVGADSRSRSRQRALRARRTPRSGPCGGAKAGRGTFRRGGSPQGRTPAARPPGPRACWVASSRRARPRGVGAVATGHVARGPGGAAPPPLPSPSAGQSPRGRGRGGRGREGRRAGRTGGAGEGVARGRSAGRAGVGGLPGGGGGGRGAMCERAARLCRAGAHRLLREPPPQGRALGGLLRWVGARMGEPRAPLAPAVPAADPGPSPGPASPRGGTAVILDVSTRRPGPRAPSSVPAWTCEAPFSLGRDPPAPPPPPRRPGAGPAPAPPRPRARPPAPLPPGGSPCESCLVPGPGRPLPPRPLPPLLGIYTFSEPGAWSPSTRPPPPYFCSGQTLIFFPSRHFMLNPHPLAGWEPLAASGPLLLSIPIPAPVVTFLRPPPRNTHTHIHAHRHTRTTPRSGATFLVLAVDPKPLYSLP